MNTQILKIGSILMLLALIFAPLSGEVHAQGPTLDDRIETAVTNGVAWLAAQQNPDGSWENWEQAAHTCLALVKLQERAYDLGYPTPFDPQYEYSDNIIAGWNYLFGTPHIQVQSPLSPQWHAGTPDDPDINGNGYGLYFGTWGHPTYTTGICLMALASSGTPDRPNEGGLDFNGNGSPDTYQEIAQEAMEWLAFGQADIDWSEGGWGYGANDNADEWADNSNSGYAVLGLAYAEDFGISVPDWVRTELNVWINFIQCQDGSDNDGGSGYSWGCDWVNELKTGNLIFELTFYGDDDTASRFQDALAYIERHWQDQNTDPGWGYNFYPADYQAMYTLMKGLEYSGIELIDTDGDAQRDDNWFAQDPAASPPQDFANLLLSQQNSDGSWNGCDWGSQIMCTTWALLTLEKVAPRPPVIEIPVDIKPGSCPNPLNPKDKGVLPVAIAGTAELDVTQIDPATIRLEGVAPLRWSYEDVATPYEPYTGKIRSDQCTKAGRDGWLDLSLKFNIQAVVAALGPVTNGEVRVLALTGNLKEEYGGTPIYGEDVMIIRKK